MILLASRSPQRATLLARAGLAFRVVDSPCDEETIDAPTPHALALARAVGKARGYHGAIAAGEVALGADTVVALDATVFGKPADRADARRILGCLQGSRHLVLTGHCCLAADGRLASEVAIARVSMRAMTPEEIADYVASGESDSRAGAYALQETGDRFVTGIDGEWDTIVGLNIATVVRLRAALIGPSSG
ncbi:MAG: Maf family protein [Planctomycetes bacterium]|nr:Maf family protein [Planctomycetota bacterium]